MRYRNISLNNTNGRYNLIKYDGECWDKQLEEFDENLVDYVKTYPTLLTEASDGNQAYMIVQGTNSVIGVLLIETSTDEKDLDIELEFKKVWFNYDKYNNEMKNFKALIDSLKLYFHDKENIEIEIHNDIDLSKIYPHQYKRMPYGPNYVTYRCVNEKNRLIPKLIEEINYDKSDCLASHQGFKISNDRSASVDDELLKEIHSGTIPSNELFNKVDGVELVDIFSDKVVQKTRVVKAFRNGDINVKVTNNNQWMDNYTFNYNVLGNGFKFHREFPKSSNDKQYTRGFFDIEVEDNSIYSEVRYGDFTIKSEKESGKKKITYISPVVDNSSIYIEAYGEGKDIKRYYIDFRTHKKSTGKINGVYSLRIVPEYDTLKFNEYSRRGRKIADLSHDLDDYKYFDNSIADNLKELVYVGLSVVDARVAEKNKNGKNKTRISPYLTNYVNDFNERYLDAVFALEQVKHEIPLPYLRNRVQEFTTSAKLDIGKPIQKIKI